MAVSEPGEDLTPDLIVWPAGRRIIRAHSSMFGSTEFDRREDADARFSTIRPDGRVQGVLYGAVDHDAAASETVFHTVPVDDGTGTDVRPRQVPLGPYHSWVWSMIACRRDLRSVDLQDHGLVAGGATREELILCGRLDYAVTRWRAEALWQAAPDADGFCWESREAAARVAVVLFEARDDHPGGVFRHELFADGPPDPFFYPDGIERLSLLAVRLNITIVF